MQELKKILEEMKNEAYNNPEIGRKQCEGMLRAMDIIRNHMNDGWIPVEDRLPEESGYYRVTVKNKELGDITEETAWFSHADDYDIAESEWREICEFEKVIAWRELDPYRPERSEE